METYPAPALVTWGIASLALLVGAAALGLASRALGTGRVWLFGLGWVGLIAAVSGSGLLANFDARPPPLALFMVALVSLSFWVGLSRHTAAVAARTPLAVLVGLQAFRLPLELVMHEAASSGVMPRELSFSGYNFDILTGAFALILAPLIALGKAPRWAVVAWNTLGFVCLFAILVIAILTAPFILALGPQSANRWVAYVPFVYLPAVMVLVAVAGHCHVARWLRQNPGPLTPPRT